MTMIMMIIVIMVMIDNGDDSDMVMLVWTIIMLKMGNDDGSGDYHNVDNEDGGDD